MVRLLHEFLGVGRAVVAVILGSFRHNLGLAVLSVGLAFGVWLFITDTEHPTRVGVLPLDIAVLPVNVPEGLTVAGPLSDVRLRIEAAEDVWDRLIVDDFKATVNLAGAQVGSQSMEVRIEVLGERSHLRVIEAIPASVSVELKPRVSLLVPVAVDVVGSPPTGYEPSSPNAAPDRVAVSGPEDLVSRVTAVVATVDLSGAVVDVRQSYPLVPRDDRGFIVEGVSLEPTTVDVEITVEQKRFNRVVAVSPSLRGSAAAGYNVTAVEVDPASVTLLGPLELLDTSVVLTDTVDITGASGDVARTVSLSLPAGVSISGPATVSVRVRIAPGQGEATFGVAPQWTGLGSHLRVVSTTPLVEVRLGGDLPTLRSVSPDQVKVSVNLADLGAGTHRLEPQVQAPAGLKVADVSPTSVEVILEAAP